MAVLSFAFDAYTLVVLVAVICSWLRLSEDHPVIRFTSALTEPVLGPIRRLLPSTGGIDISPMLLLLALRLIRRLILV
ncbi:MAG: YggT family protein [Myxococcales bacterium]|jgi:YggT family protein